MPLDHLRALFIGRDVPKKGLLNLLQAWEGIPSPHQLTVISKTNRTMPRGATSIGFYRMARSHLNPCTQSADTSGASR